MILYPLVLDFLTVISYWEILISSVILSVVVPPSHRMFLSVTERNFLWLGGTTTDSMTPEIDPFHYARVINTSNTKGYKIIPYSGELK